jgi:trafficking protein particle complex subunit 10
MLMIIARFLYLNALLDLAHPDHPAIAMRVSSDAKIAEAEDGSFLDVTVQNHLPCVSTFKNIFTTSLVVSQELPIDHITVVLAGRDKERLNFSASAERLAQGPTPLRLFCAVSVLMYSPMLSISFSRYTIS